MSLCVDCDLPGSSHNTLPECIRAVNDHRAALQLSLNLAEHEKEKNEETIAAQAKEIAELKNNSMVFSQCVFDALGMPKRGNEYEATGAISKLTQERDAAILRADRFEKALRNISERLMSGTPSSYFCEIEDGTEEALGFLNQFHESVRKLATEALADLTAPAYVRALETQTRKDSGDAPIVTVPMPAEKCTCSAPQFHHPACPKAAREQTAKTQEESK